MRLLREAGDQREELANLLGVKAAALEMLNVGWDHKSQCWTFPERNASGQIIGVCNRSLDGEKKRRAGGKAGLTYADNWDAGDHPVILVEGGSDTAALLGIGLPVVGRPSNRGGVDLLLELLGSVPPSREIIVIAEQDQKPDGRWPGRDGAISTAEQLSERLDRRISWSLPPDHAKDSRAWLNAMPQLPDDRLRALFVSGLEPTNVEPPVCYPLPLHPAPTVKLTSWREAMLQARVEVLNCPGFYLDRSVTGAGKSHADFTALLHGCSSEAV